MRRAGDQIGEQRTFTAGRIVVEGRGASKRADYLLFYQPSYSLAVIEAKATYKRVGDGMQQARSLKLWGTNTIICAMNRTPRAPGNSPLSHSIAHERRDGASQLSNWR